MEQQITRTVFSSQLQSMLYARIPFSVQQNTTLNEKFGILPGILPLNNGYPAAKYLCIGNGGHAMSTGTGGIALSQALTHKATDPALFNHLPFALRAVNNDLTSAEQQKYALRKTVTYGGQQYYAYYLKRLDTSSAVISTIIQTRDGDTITTSNFVPNPLDLSPTPTTLNPDSVNLLAGQDVVVSATLPLVLTAQEVQEIRDAATIIHGSPAYAIISEMGLVQASDYPITLANGNQFMEVVCAQIGAFIVDNTPLQYRDTVNTSLDLGTNEPLLVLEEQA